jgi:hypothetical protein
MLKIVLSWTSRVVTTCWYSTLSPSEYIFSSEKRPNSSNIISSTSLRRDKSLQALVRLMNSEDEAGAAIACGEEA